MGVREEPYFDIPVARYIWPILHTLSGVGNGILDYLIDMIESENQHIPAKEVHIKRELHELEKLYKELQTARNVWDSGNVGSGIDFMKVHKKELQRLETEMERLEDIRDHLNKSYANLFTCAEMKKEKVAELELQRSNMTTDVAGASKAVSKKKENVASCRRACKCESDLMYTGVDLILQKYAITRAANHGGVLNGGDIKKMMTNTSTIMAELKQYLLDTKHKNCIKPDEGIIELCDSVEWLLLLLDRALAMLHVEDPVEADFEKAQKYIDQAVAKMRKLDISVAVKGHGASKHAVEQMRHTAQFGGLFDSNELWGKQYHQVGYRLDMKFRNRGSTVRKAQTRATENA